MDDKPAKRKTKKAKSKRNTDRYGKYTPKGTRRKEENASKAPKPKKEAPPSHETDDSSEEED